MSKAKAELAKFWEQNEGKLIKSYGKWLIAYGVIIAIACAFWIFYILMQTRGLELTGLGVGVLVFYFACICSAIYYIYAGIKIKSENFSPTQIRNTSTAVITLVLITIACQVFLNAQLGGTTTVVFGILDLITLIDSFRYKSRCHEAYENFYENNNSLSKKAMSSDSIKTRRANGTNEKDKHGEWPW